MKKVWKSNVAILGVTVLSLGLLPGNLAESAGLAVKSKAANGYQIKEDPNDFRVIRDSLPSGDNFSEVESYANAALQAGDIQRSPDGGGTENNPEHIYIYATRGEAQSFDDDEHPEYGEIRVWAFQAWGNDDEVNKTALDDNDNWPTYLMDPQRNPTIVWHIFLLNDTTSDNISGGSSANYPHTHNYNWVVDMDASMEKDGEALYRCSCGDVKYRQPIPASEAYVKKLYGEIRIAAQGATVTFDAKKNSCISDYIIGILAQRSDVTTTITFEYKNVKYQFTIPAGTDFTSLLNDDEKFYGFFGFCGKLGIPVNQI